MAGRRFPGSMFGFNKTAVNTYIETMIKDYEEKLSAKDMELEKVSKQLMKITDRYEELKLEEETIRSEKEKITGALVKANEKAEQILAEARDRAAREVGDLEAAAEREREKIVDIRKQLMKMKADAAVILSSYSEAVNNIILDEGWNSSEEEVTEEANSSEAAYEASAQAEDSKENDDFFA
ncbi:MAG TPA: DivIVA domain-containing protein [Clostridia bacterium]|nr:DivIVA domain-containing protein [Clostridia bacterium]